MTVKQVLELQRTYSSIVSIQEEDKGKTGYQSEIKQISLSSFPLVLALFLQYFLAVSSVYTAGKIGPKELAAATLATSSLTISGLGVYQGIATCLDTLCTQAFGAQKYDMVGLYFLQCSFVGICIAVFSLVKFRFFFKSFVSDQEVALMAQQYLRIVLFGSPGVLLFETGKRYLQAQSIYQAGTYVLIIVTPIHMFFNWLLVLNRSTSLGLNGSP